MTNASRACCRRRFRLARGVPATARTSPRSSPATGPAMCRRASRCHWQSLRNFQGNLGLVIRTALVRHVGPASRSRPDRLQELVCVARGRVGVHTDHAFTNTHFATERVAPQLTYARLSLQRRRKRAFGATAAYLSVAPQVIIQERPLCGKGVGLECCLVPRGCAAFQADQYEPRGADPCEYCPGCPWHGRNQQSDCRHVDHRLRRMCVAPSRKASPPGCLLTQLATSPEVGNSYATTVCIPGDGHDQE
jgi:hypothetical protein